ncbi:MAG: efflux RND transporter periplasmic adaptor subunit, partial [Terriglobales bacterium]
AAGVAAPALTWVQPQRRRLLALVTTSGSVRLRSGAEVRVGSQVSGIVNQLEVAVGSVIRAGDIIARIDARPLQAKVDQAQALVQVGEVAFAKASRDAARGRQLLAAGLVPRQQGEDLDWQLASAQAQLASARSQLTAAQMDLGYAVIRAPISGTVASVSTQEGETVAAAFAAPTFITIVDQRALELVGLVDETDIGSVRRGDRVQFTVETYPDRPLSATVTRIDPTATIISGVINYAVVARLEPVASFLRPDMTANLAIATGSREAWMLPDSAIARDRGGSFVLVQRGGGAERRAVSVGTRQAGWSEVTSGIGPGDRIALQPAGGGTA